MTASTQTAPRARPVTGLRRYAAVRIRPGRELTQDAKLVAGLFLLALVVTVAVAVAPADIPTNGLMVPLVLGSLLLGPRYLPWFVGVVFVLLLIAIAAQPMVTSKVLVSAGVQVLLCLIVLITSLRRTRLGVAGIVGESMLVDLRDRILNQGGIPALPPGWHVESALRSSGGTLFAGDFLVAARPGPDRFEVVVVDVSGKGEGAGTRALLLSGAFGGLLGALPSAGFLPAANDYLLRQQWEEGFATAIHLSVQLDTGCYEIRTAGHPPALHHLAAGAWVIVPSEGPILGLMDDAEFVTATGVLGPGDAILLYTDGMVEEPHLDLDTGIERLRSEADAVLVGARPGPAEQLVQAVGSRDDDRAILVVQRS